MKKFLSVTLLAVLGLSMAVAPAAQASESPKVESVKFTPTEIELTSSNTTVSVELVVSHPSGVQTPYVLAKLSNGSTIEYSIKLDRTESPVNYAAAKITFAGSSVLPNNILEGPYTLTISEVKNNPSAGYQYSTGTITVPEFRKLYGAENSLLVRKSGKLNYAIDTFIGPTTDATLANSFTDKVKYNPQVAPIFRVGEIYDPNKYFELVTSGLQLSVDSSSPTICSSDGKILTFLAVGACNFKVYTAATNDYKEFIVYQSANIGTKRVKPTFNVGTVDTQASKDLPKNIQVAQVYSQSEGWILPKSATPNVCIASGYTVQIISGGTCTLTYQTSESGDWLASDLYKLTFEITRDAQTMTFDLPATAKVGSKGLTLSATASSAGAVTFAAAPTNVCEVSGTTLNLKGKGTCQVTATQSGTTTIAPVSATKSIAVSPASVAKKTITCVKGSKKIKTNAAKCPKGYKKR